VTGCEKMDEIDVLKVIWDVSMLIRNLSEEIKNLKKYKIDIRHI